MNFFPREMYDSGYFNLVAHTCSVTEADGLGSVIAVVLLSVTLLVKLAKPVVNEVRGLAVDTIIWHGHGDVGGVCVPAVVCWQQIPAI